MKWIVILTTVFTFSAVSALADEQMPQANPADALAAEKGLVEKPAASRVAVAKKPAKKSSEIDYAPAQNMLLSAMSLIGVKYRWGGDSPEEGLDCSGFIRYVFQNSLNITLPRTAASMAQTGQRIDKGELKPGDLVFFNTLGRTFSHVGIYLGDNRFIHSPRTGRSVEVANMNENYWQRRFTGARRVADADGEKIDVNSLLAAGDNTATAGPRANVAGGEAKCRKVKKGHKTVLKCEKTPARSGKATQKAEGKSSAKKGKATEKSASKKSSKSTAGASKKNTSSSKHKKSQ